MKFLSTRLAPKIARRYAPTIQQGYKSILDPITKIYLGDFDPYLTDEPVVYYSVKRDDRYYYCLYCFFHRNDWSELPWPIKSLDEHEYDFEGILTCVNRSNGSGQFSFTISHGDMLAYRHGNWYYVMIEPGGHGVSLITPEYTKTPGWFYDNKIIYNPGAYKLINIGTRAKIDWLKKDIAPVVNKSGVNLPWQWRNPKIPNSMGMIWSQPDVLLKMAFEKCLF